MEKYEKISLIIRQNALFKEAFSQYNCYQKKNRTTPVSYKIQHIAINNRYLIDFEYIEFRAWTPRLFYYVRLVLVPLRSARS